MPTLKSRTKLRGKRYEWGTVATIETFASTKTLLLDFDMARPIPCLITLLARVRIIGLRTRWVSYRRTVHGWHVEVGINASLKPSEQVAAQFALGSDPRRETMNLRRAISLRIHPRGSRFWKKRWNILFQDKLWKDNCQFNHIARNVSITFYLRLGAIRFQTPGTW